MLKFKDYRPIISESVEAPQKLKHLEHVEDRVLQSGDAGFQHATNTLRGMHNFLSGEKSDVKVGEKFDGAPSLVWGTNPENGKFFVSTKSWGNKTPKINYSAEDIERNHGHAPGLVEKLKAALEHLPKVTPKGKIYQGDVMYTDRDLMHDDGHTSFTPNTITYRIPQNTSEGKKAAMAKLGIAAHTEYEGGNTLDSLRPRFGPDLGGFGKHKDVHVISTETRANPENYTKKDKDEFERYMSAAQDAYSKLHPDAHAVAQQHIDHIMPYINSEVRRGGRPTHQGFRDFVMERGQKEIGKLKSAPAIERKTSVHNQRMSDIEKNKGHIQDLFDLHGHLQNAKNVLARVAAKNKRFGTHIAGQESGPEGMVVINPKTNTIDKAVDRDEFSAANFAKNQTGKFISQK